MMQRNAFKSNIDVRCITNDALSQRSKDELSCCIPFGAVLNFRPCFVVFAGGKTHPNKLSEASVSAVPVRGGLFNLLASFRELKEARVNFFRRILIFFTRSKNSNHHISGSLVYWII